VPILAERERLSRRVRVAGRRIRYLWIFVGSRLGSDVRKLLKIHCRGVIGVTEPAIKRYTYPPPHNPAFMSRVDTTSGFLNEDLLLKAISEDACFGFLDIFPNFRHN